MVSHSIAPSARSQPLAVADKAAKKKNKKYQALAEYQNAAFHPFACEALGGMSRSAKKIISLIADITTNNCSWLSRRTVINELSDAVAIHIQRGNAAMVRAGEVQRRIASRHLSQ